MDNKNIYNIKLAQYILNYKAGDCAPESDPHGYTIDPRLYNETQINLEVNEILLKLRRYFQADLKTFHIYTKHIAEQKIDEERETKAELLEHHQFYDKYLIYILRDFTNLALALLLKLERMHKKNILCGNVNPYTFLYLRKFRTCEPEDLSLLLSDKETVNAERKTFGDYIYTITILNKVSYNKYLAPELRETLLVYHLQHRLEALSFAANARGIVLPQQVEIDRDLRDLHQKRIKYTNRAEIYSVGYTLNQIFSHTLSKHAHLGLLMNEFPKTAVSQDIFNEAEELLPIEFANPHKERITELVNNAVSYVHALMNEHMEKRDTLEVSIEKFQSLLKRISTTKQDIILEEESELEDDHEFRREDQEMPEEIEHEEEEAEEEEEEEAEELEKEDAEEEEEEDEEREELEFEAAELEEAEEAEEHEHEEHEHAEHEHEEHEHGGHEHAEHGHAEHAEHEHEHEHEEHEEHDEHEEHGEHAEHHEHAGHEAGHSNHHDAAHGGGAHAAHSEGHEEHTGSHEVHNTSHDSAAHVVDETGTRLRGGRTPRPGHGVRH